MVLCRVCIFYLFVIEEGNFKDNYLKFVYEYSMVIIRLVLLLVKEYIYCIFKKKNVFSYYICRLDLI